MDRRKTPPRSSPTGSAASHGRKRQPAGWHRRRDGLERIVGPSEPPPLVSFPARVGAAVGVAARWARLADEADERRAALAEVVHGVAPSASRGGSNGSRRGRSDRLLVELNDEMGELPRAQSGVSALASVDLARELDDLVPRHVLPPEISHARVSTPRLTSVNGGCQCWTTVRRKASIRSLARLTFTSHGRDDVNRAPDQAHRHRHVPALPPRVPSLVVLDLSPADAAQARPARRSEVPWLRLAGERSIRQVGRAAVAGA